MACFCRIFCLYITSGNKFVLLTNQWKAKQFCQVGGELLEDKKKGNGDACLTDLYFKGVVDIPIR